jgi:hypothetical protein
MTPRYLFLAAAALLGPACSSKQGADPTELAHPSSSTPPSPGDVVEASSSAFVGDEDPPPITTSDPSEATSRSDLFAAKIRFLDEIDQAVVRGPAAAFEKLSAPEATSAGCSSSAGARLASKVQVSEDCIIPAGAAMRRVAINVGTRAERETADCSVERLEKSELFYRVDGRLLKVTVDAIAVDTRVYLRKIRCHRAERAAAQPEVSNCSGKWPLVTQTREFAKCPWVVP